MDPLCVAFRTDVGLCFCVFVQLLRSTNTFESGAFKIAPYSLLHVAVVGGGAEARPQCVRFLFVFPRIEVFDSLELLTLIF